MVPATAAKWQRKVFCSSWIMQSPQLPKRRNGGLPAGEASVGMFSLVIRSRFSIVFVVMRSLSRLWPIKVAVLAIGTIASNRGPSTKFWLSPEKLLDRSNAVAVFEKMGAEAVSERMATHRPLHAGSRHAAADRLLDHVVFEELTDRVEVLAIAQDRKRPGYCRA